MATIGLKVDHGSWGTDVGAALAKALTPNVSDQVAVARLKDQMLTEEYQRRLIQENTTLATQQAIRQWQINQQEHTKFGAQTDAGPVYGRILRDSQGRPIAQTTEAPAVVPDTVVQTGGGGRVPEMLRGWDERTAPPSTGAPPAVTPEEVVATAPPPIVEANTQQPSYAAEPDWQYRINQYPLHSDIEPPAPIELPPFMGAQVGELPVAAMPGLGGEVMLPQPAPDSGVVVGGSQPVVGGSEPLVGGGGPTEPVPLPGFLQHLLRPIGELGPEQPEIITPETTAMLAGMEQPAQQPPIPDTDYVPPASVGGLPLPPEAPVPVEAATALEPVINPLTPEPPLPEPIPVGEPEVITLPGRPAVTPETTAATPATVPPAPAEAPSTAAPAPDRGPLVEAAPQGTITTKAPGSVGTGTVNPDGSSTYQTDQGPVPLSKEETDKLGLAIAYGNDPGGQTGKLAGVLKTIYDPGVTLTPNQKAELLSGVSPIGTPEETASKIAVEKATGDIKTKTIAGREYTLATTPDGRTVATLVEGQPAAAKVSRFGESAEGYMRTGISDLMVNKPDPKTWDATERQDFAIMVDALYGAKVTVSENGKITIIKGKLPEGVLPGSAGFDARNPPPPTVAETPPAETQAAPAAPAAPAPGSTAPAPVSTAPAPAEQPPAAEEGRPTEMIEGVKVKNYGGWLRTGEQPKQTTSDTAAGEVTQIESTGPSDMDEQVGKEFGYTKNVLTPGKYMLDITSDQVPELSGQAIEAVTSGSSLLQVLGSTVLTPKERQYFKQVQRFINAVTHKSSGADVTAADLRTYRYLFSLPPKEVLAASDLRDFKNSVIEDIKNSRTGWNGRVPSGQLREFDLDLARRGIDLDKIYSDADAGMVEHFDVEEK